MKRQIVLDTETTGLSPKAGHRIIEIGCIELVNRKKTGEHFHYYINPEREVDQGAQAVHGISNEFLSDKPLFSDIVEDFMAWIEGAELIIHNAPFDVGFLEHELRLIRYPVAKIDQVASVLDTLTLAREKHPGQKNSLDVLCKRYDVNNEHRTLHGALLDSELLADVYLAMTGGQSSLFAQEQKKQMGQAQAQSVEGTLSAVPLSIVKASTEEQKLHQAYLERIGAEDGF